jgi:GT2 family glycosyltransferase/glycosyltransferase involved in cell wall biosynthesis
MGIQASISILTYNNLDYTRMCLDSIYGKTDASEFEVIVVDNASTDTTPQFLEEYASEHPNLKAIFNKVNQGFARGNNIGAAEATGDHLVFLNNDTVVTKGWLSGLLGHLQDMAVGMVGPVTNSSGNESQIEVDYQNLEGMDEFAAKYTQAHQGAAFEIRMLPFQCVALRRSVFEEVGPLDESFGIGMFEDDDYALRLRERGYKILCAEDVFIHHWGSASFSQLEPSLYWEIYKKNLKKFEVKWDRKWVPHTQRPEFIAEQMRQMLEDSMWLRDVIGERESTINWLNAELENIYESNGWAFLQFLLRIRRFLIPEGSRREDILKSVIDALHEFRPSRLVDIWRAIIAAFQEGKAESKEEQILFGLAEGQIGPVRSSERPAVIPALPERFPWPMVSVILPVYNHADMLAGAGRSVLSSKYPNLELIILDDGSTDDIEPVLKRFANNPRVRIFRQPNQKLPRALTHAHQYARGDFITWTSSDNLMTPDALEIMVDGLLSHPEAVLVYADVSLIDNRGKPLRGSDYRPQNQDPSRPEVMRFYKDARPLGFEADNYINACFLYRREAAQVLEGYFADDLHGLEDYDFWLRLQKTGCLYHIENDVPLYYYRVHTRTMSHELLSRDETRDRHLKRIDKFIIYEEQRREYTQRRWRLVIGESLTKGERDSLARIAAQLPVDLHFDEKELVSEAKQLHFISATATTTSDPVYVRNLPEDWQLTWCSTRSNQWETLHLWKGISIHPLALKAREHQRNPWEFPQVGNRIVIGCHCGLANLPVDAAATRQVISKNPEAFFVFLDEASTDHAPLAQEIVNGLENAVYLGPRAQEKSYHIYACFDSFWLPPFLDDISDHDYLSQLALAYTTARPLLVPEHSNLIPAPYQYRYQSFGESLNFIRSLNHLSIDKQVLNQYLDIWTPVSRLSQLLKYADAITQDWAVSRPDFGIKPAPISSPASWRPVFIKNGEAIKCALAVNSLRKGGLEEVVAQLARRLSDHNFDTFIICVDAGGEVADRLQSEGIRVYNAGGNPRRMREILQKERPNLVNSHWAGVEFLKVVVELGIPIIENIHNMYVWMDEQGWEVERRRSRYFSHAIAVSQLVKRYYLKHNYAFSADWISVIPNGIDTSSINPIDQAAARRRLELPESNFIFLNLASYDGRKNQLGLMAAFERVAQAFPEARLLFAGDVSNSEYYKRLQAYREKLRSKVKILLYEFQKDSNLLLSAADVFVINSFYEGWSLAATEAVHAGLPLIHSDCGSAVELVGEDQERGMVIPNPAGEPLELNWDSLTKAMWQTSQRNTDYLIRAMSRMIEDRAKWNVRRSEIRKHAMKSYSIENMLREYKNAFQSVLES